MNGFTQTAVEELITFERLSPKILIVKMGEVYPDQVVAVASEKGLVLIDSGISPTISKKYRYIIEREFGRDDFAYVVNTHHHFDHTNGNQVFSEAVIVAHENCPERMCEFIEGIPDFIRGRRERYTRRWKLAQSLDSSSDMYKRFRDLVVMSTVMCKDLKGDFELTLPTMTFRDRLTIDLGDMTLKLLYFGSGLHTDNDIIVYIPEEGLAFTGDLFRDYQTTAGVTSDGELKNWIEALDSILQESEELKHVVTIHAGLLSPERLINARDSFKNLLNELRGKTSAAALLEQQIEQLGVRAAVDQFRKMNTQRKKRYYILEGDFIELGYRLLSRDKIDVAVAVFELNAEMFPQSLDTNDCLGEAYMTAGDKERAVKVFRRSLEMYPLNSYAFDMIHLLQHENRE